MAVLVFFYPNFSSCKKVSFSSFPVKDLCENDLVSQCHLPHDWTKTNLDLG